MKKKKRAQIYNIENAYYNLSLTFLNNFTFCNVNFYELRKSCHELHEFPLINFFQPQINELKELKKKSVEIFYPDSYREWQKNLRNLNEKIIRGNSCNSWRKKIN